MNKCFLFDHFINLHKTPGKDNIKSRVSVKINEQRPRNLANLVSPETPAF